MPTIEQLHYYCMNKLELLMDLYLLGIFLWSKKVESVAFIATFF